MRRELRGAAPHQRCSNGSCLVPRPPPPLPHQPREKAKKRVYTQSLQAPPGADGTNTDPRHQAEMLCEEGPVRERGDSLMGWLPRMPSSPPTHTGKSAVGHRGPLLPKVGRHPHLLMTLTQLPDSQQRYSTRRGQCSQEGGE